MLPILLIIVCLGFSYMGLKKGLYVMFATLFNILFAVFIAVLSTRKLLSYSSQYEHNGNYAALGVLLIFCLIFGLLQIFAWFYFLRLREDYFPKSLDRVGGFLVGGLCGYLFYLLIILTLCILPWSVEGKMDWFSGRDKMKALSVPGVCKACNFLGWYSLECFYGDSERSVDWLLGLSESSEPDEEIISNPQEPSSGGSNQNLPGED